MHSLALSSSHISNPLLSLSLSLSFFSTLPPKRAGRRSKMCGLCVYMTWKCDTPFFREGKLKDLFPRPAYRASSSSFAGKIKVQRRKPWFWKVAWRPLRSGGQIDDFMIPFRELLRLLFFCFPTVHDSVWQSGLLLLRPPLQCSVLSSNCTKTIY